MPTGPKGQKRPADVIGNAVKIARIATGEDEDDFAADDGKDKAAQALAEACALSSCDLWPGAGVRSSRLVIPPRHK